MYRFVQVTQLMTDVASHHSRLRLAGLNRTIADTQFGLNLEETIFIFSPFFFPLVVFRFPECSSRHESTEAEVVSVTFSNKC